MSCMLFTYMFYFFQSFKLQTLHLFWATSSLAFRQTIECGFTLKRVCDMIITYSQMDQTVKFYNRLIVWSVWLNSWVFLYELSDCESQSLCSHLNVRYHSCFEQGVPWHSGNNRERIQSKAHTWPCNKTHTLKSVSKYLVNHWMQFLKSKMVMCNIPDQIKSF